MRSWKNLKDAQLIAGVFRHAVGRPRRRHHELDFHLADALQATEHVFRVLQQLRPGMHARIHLPQGQTVNGTVRQLAPTISTETLNGIAYVDLPSGSSLAAGMFLSGEFELPATEVLAVPASAVVFRTGLHYVMQIGNDNRVHELKVQTGRRRGADIEILEGLGEEARLAVAGGTFLNDGDLVSVARTTAAP